MLNVSLHLRFATLKSVWPSLLASLVFRQLSKPVTPILSCGFIIHQKVIFRAPAPSNAEAVGFRYEFVWMVF
jgi:hypothetical protein